MKHNYTRQRQGRDFSHMPSKPGIIDRLRRAAMDTESNRNTDGTSGINKTMDDSEHKKSILIKLEQYKDESERNAVPIDGDEPPEEIER